MKSFFSTTVAVRSVDATRSLSYCYRIYAWHFWMDNIQQTQVKIKYIRLKLGLSSSNKFEFFVVKQIASKMKSKTF